jgi:transposase
MHAKTIPKDIRKRYCERGLEGALHDAPRPGQPKKITAEHEEFVVATACMDAPEGHNQWTLEVLRDKLIETYDDLQSVSHEWIRHMLLRAALKPWREKNVVHAKPPPRSFESAWMIFSPSTPNRFPKEKKSTALTRL